MLFCTMYITLLRLGRLLFAGAERGSRDLQGMSNPHCVRVRAAEDASRGPFRVLERRHGLAEVVKRGAGVFVKRLRVSPPHHEREIITIPESASRHRRRLAQQCLGFFEAP